MTAVTPFLADQLLAFERSRNESDQRAQDREPSLKSDASLSEVASLSGLFRKPGDGVPRLLDTITIISGETNTGKTYLSFRLLAEHLLKRPGSSAAIIDTLGGLELLWLKKVLAATLYESGSGRPKENAEQDTNQLLARVRVIRAFDHIGIQEALDEVKATHHMLPDEGGGKIDFVIIDNLTNCFTPLIKTNYTSGHAVLSSFLRSLSGLCRSHSIATVVINNAVPHRQSVFGTYGAGQQPGDPTGQVPFFSINAEPTSSIFSTTAAQAQPALGKTLQRFATLHILTHAEASTPGDWIVGSHSHSATIGKETSEGLVNSHLVAEVIGDRSSTRRGRWTAFKIGKMGEWME